MVKERRLTIWGVWTLLDCYRGGEVVLRDLRK